MGADPLDEIMGYLGLGSLPPEAGSIGTSKKACSAHTGELDPDGAELLAASDTATLWLTGNENAEWVELRGSFATVRVTRPKAKLLIDAREVLERWARGDSPQVKTGDLSIKAARRFGALVLEVSYRTWKPVRLSRPQAKALLAVFEPLRSFAAR